MVFFRCCRNRLVNHQHFGIILPQDGFQGVQLIHSWIQDHIRVLFEFPIHPDKCRMGRKAASRESPGRMLYAAKIDDRHLSERTAP